MTNKAAELMQTIEQCRDGKGLADCNDCEIFPLCTPWGNYWDETQPLSEAEQHQVKEVVERVKQMDAEIKEFWESPEGIERKRLWDNLDGSEKALSALRDNINPHWRDDENDD